MPRTINPIIHWVLPASCPLGAIFFFLFFFFFPYSTVNIFVESSSLQYILEENGKGKTVKWEFRVLKGMTSQRKALSFSSSGERMLSASSGSQHGTGPIAVSFRNLHLVLSHSTIHTFFFFWPNIPLVAPNIILTYSLEFLFIYLFLWRVFEYRSLKIGIACIILCRLWKKEKKFKKWRVGWTLFCPPFLAIFPLGLATSMGGILADSTFSTVWGRY